MSHRGRKRTSVIREELRKEAQERQEAYNALSIEEKLAKLPPEPQAQKQRNKLLAQLENRDKPVEKQEHPAKEKIKAKDRKSKESRGIE
jgi:hypothetical protein